MDMTESIAPRSDQMNAEDLLTGPRTFTISAVVEPKGERSFGFILSEFHEDRPYYPCLTMRKVMVNIWGAESSTYPGKRLTLYNDPEVTFGRDKPGGIRISHMSHIDKSASLMVTVKRGKREPFTVQPLPKPAPVDPRLAALKAEYQTASPERQAEILAEKAAIEGAGA